MEKGFIYLTKRQPPERGECGWAGVAEKREQQTRMCEKCAREEKTVFDSSRQFFSFLSQLHEQKSRNLIWIIFVTKLIHHPVN